ncbi:methyltransferase-like protein 25B isoform X2 [Liolophura sinensis]
MIMKSTDEGLSQSMTETGSLESFPRTEWFARCLEFLRDFSWIYDYQVTEFFVEQPWRSIPDEWREFLLGLSLEELNVLPLGNIKDEWPDNFSTFVQTALEMSMPRGSYSVTPVEIPCELKKGMNPKKQHEVSLMAAVLHQLMEEASVSVVVDIGAGLGYLGQVLQQRYGYRVISLECDDSRSHGAQCRNIKLGQDAGKFVSLTFDLQDNAEVMNQFQDLITGIVRQGDLEPGSEVREAKGQEVKVCMTGLHCCGDLTSTMLKYFTKLDCVTLLAGVSCCYHRMALSSGENVKVYMKNFPMSRSCQAAMFEVRSASRHWTLGTPAFRLAAQETRARWLNQSKADHAYHQRNVAFRGILELFCHEENLTLNKISRKLALKKNCETFDDYVEAVFSRTNLTPVGVEADDSVEEWKKKLHKTYLQCEEFFAFIEPLTCLQVLLQPVLENLIHQDRQRFLQEQGFQAYLLPVFDEFISPRNLVLVGTKCEKTLSCDTCVTCGKTVSRDTHGKSVSCDTCGKT